MSHPQGHSAPSSRPSKGVNAYIPGKWDTHLGVSHQDVLANICENVFLMDGVTPTHRALGPFRAQFHRIIIHILLSQSGPYQRVTLYDSLIIYAILNNIEVDKEPVLEEDEEENLPPPSTANTSSSHKYLVNGIVNDVLQEFVNLTK
ncbi:hypothetical protein AHAS_Ahas17G0164100 [Arachis hypogaea]